MFILLSKLLPLFVYPLGLACMLLLTALLVNANRKLSLSLNIAALIILWISSTSGLSNYLARSLELQHLPPAQVPPGQVLVVLGGGTEPAASPRGAVEVNGAGDRVLYAADLYREGKVAQILLSGGEIEWLGEGSSTPAEDMAELLMRMGVPAEALILEKKSRNTYENALYTKELLEQQDIHEILLVTSALHMPRALALFEKQGFTITPLPVDFSVTDAIASRGGAEGWAGKFIDILPSASNLGLTTNALKEYLGMVIYKLQGWL